MNQIIIIKQQLQELEELKCKVQQWLFGLQNNDNDQISSTDNELLDFKEIVELISNSQCSIKESLLKILDPSIRNTSNQINSNSEDFLQNLNTNTSSFGENQSTIINENVTNTHFESNTKTPFLINNRTETDEDLTHTLESIILLIIEEVKRLNQLWNLEIKKSSREEILDQMRIGIINTEMFSTSNFAKVHDEILLTNFDEDSSIIELCDKLALENAACLTELHMQNDYISNTANIVSNSSEITSLDNIENQCHSLVGEVEVNVEEFRSSYLKLERGLHELTPGNILQMETKLGCTNLNINQNDASEFHQTNDIFFNNVNDNESINDLNVHRVSITIPPKQEQIISTIKSSLENFELPNDLDEKSNTTFESMVTINLNNEIEKELSTCDLNNVGIDDRFIKNSVWFIEGIEVIKDGSENVQNYKINIGSYSLEKNENDENVKDYKLNSEDENRCDISDKNTEMFSEVKVEILNLTTEPFEKKESDVQNRENSDNIIVNENAALMEYFTDWRDKGRSEDSHAEKLLEDREMEKNLISDYDYDEKQCDFNKSVQKKDGIPITVTVKHIYDSEEVNWKYKENIIEKQTEDLDKKIANNIVTEINSENNFENLEIKNDDNYCRKQRIERFNSTEIIGEAGDKNKFEYSIGVFEESDFDNLQEDIDNNDSNFYPMLTQNGFGDSLLAREDPNSSMESRNRFKYCSLNGESGDKRIEEKRNKNEKLSLECSDSGDSSYQCKSEEYSSLGEVSDMDNDDMMYNLGDFHIKTKENTNKREIKMKIIHTQNMTTKSRKRNNIIPDSDDKVPDNDDVALYSKQHDDALTNVKSSTEKKIASYNNSCISYWMLFLISLLLALFISAVLLSNFSLMQNCKSNYILRSINPFSMRTFAPV